MSTSNNPNWEDQWRKEMYSHTPLPSNEDWRGMNRLLDLKAPAPALAQHIIEQEPIGFDPWRSIKKTTPNLGWPLWIGLLLLVTALGVLLLSINGEPVHPEMKATIVAQDTFPPHYALDRYWTYDKEGNRVGAMHSDTIWQDHHVRKRGPHALISSGKVSDYRIDTVLHVSGRGDILSVRIDTIIPYRGRRQEARPSEEHHDSGHDDCAQNIIYKMDTIYQLDTLGNLTDGIHAIDTTIIYLPGGTI